MSTSKKLKLDKRSQLFCKLCQHLEEEKEEIVVLTDPRLNHLYDRDTPQHRITGFTIHDIDGTLCWFDTKPIEEGNQLFLCGYVEPIVANSDPKDDSNDRLILAQKIGPLQEWWFAGFDGGDNVIIGLESEFASYVLCKPNEDYLNLFTKCTQNVFLTKLIIESLLKNPDYSYEDLIQNIEERDQNFSQESVLLFSPFIVEQIKSFDSAAEEDETLLSETPAFKKLVQLSGLSDDSRVVVTSHNSHLRPIARFDARRAANSDTLTCGTPLVTKFFDSLFKDVIECHINESQNERQTKSTSVANIYKILNEKNKKVNWIGSPTFEDQFARTSYYSSVKINELMYTSGEFVLFREADNSCKWGRLMFMFSTSDKQKLCHIHYICTGKDTILAETAPNRLVFMTTKCNNIEVQRIEDKLNVVVSEKYQLNVTEENCDQYFCSKLYTEKFGRFEDLPKEVFDCDLKCIGCLIKERKQRQKTPQLLDEMITEETDSNKYKRLVYKNHNYCVGDCALFSSDAFPINVFNYFNKQIEVSKVDEYDETLYPERYRKRFTHYIKGLNNDLPKTLNIGVIEEIFKQSCDSVEECKLLVNMFYRPHNIYHNYNDFRFCALNLLFWSNHKVVVDVHSLRGRCQVIYSKTSLEIDFFEKTKLFYFNQCYHFKEQTFLEPNEELKQRFTPVIEETVNDVYGSKLNVLDLFAGCGGLSYGFHERGLVSELWAIEKDESAVQSFKANFKSAHVFHEDVNHILDQLIKGIKTDKNGQNFPDKHQIDLILGGPPCQGFSGMNRFSCRQYSLFKNSLVVSFLSYVDFYRPKYLILENVRNFALFKGSMVLKLTLSCLISMGYQCHTAVLQSGSYGSPQTRRRCVIIGASTGNPLPSFPEPTHVFSRRQCQLSVTIDNRRYSPPITTCAQFRAITIDDAISDLPQLGEDYASDAVRHYPINGQLTHYQTIMRKGCAHQLRDHYCKEMSQLCRLRIENIPKTLGSDWRDLPNITHTFTDGTVVSKLNYNFKDLRNGSSNTNQLRGVCPCAQGLQCNPYGSKQESTLIPWCLVHTANRQYNWSGLYGRLAFNGYFPTTVTNPEPMSKQGRVLHPNQDRIISIRESARSQGFPDHFVFIGTVSQKYRQIGNAVPIPLSFALSRQFFD